MPVEADVPEFIAVAGKQKEATELLKAVGDLTLITTCYGWGSTRLKGGETKANKQYNSGWGTLPFLLEQSGDSDAFLVMQPRTK